MPTIAPSPSIPDAIREELKRPRKIGDITSKHGGADPAARGLISNLVLQNPSVQAHNAYVEHLSEHIIGYVTFLGTVAVTPTGEVVETVHQFGSANGEARMLQRFISEPIYFDADWEHFTRESTQRNPIFLVSEQPLNPARLERRAELRAPKTHPLNELYNIARELKITGYEKLKRDDVVEKILDREFPSDDEPQE